MLIYAIGQTCPYGFGPTMLINRRAGAVFQSIRFGVIFVLRTSDIAYGSDIWASPK